jgi:hypothetical protein
MVVPNSRSFNADNVEIIENMYLKILVVKKLAMV